MASIWLRGLITVLCFFCVAATAGAAATDPSPRLTPKQAAQDLRILQRALVDLHPGLYRYTTPDQMRARFDAAQASVTGGADRTQLYLLATYLAASVRCGHTWTNPANQPDALRKVLLARGDALPLRLRLVQDRWLVTASADATIREGDEILAIDGRSGPQIVEAMLPYLRADGGNDGKRRSQLDSGENGGAMDRLFPLLFPPVDGHYRLRVRAPAGHAREASVASMNVDAREAALAENGRIPPEHAWTFRIDGDTAWLVVPTLAFWGGGFDANAFLQRTFDRLAREHVRYLVIDARDNEGGDGAIGEALLAHLLRSPATIADSRGESAYERVPYVLARYLDTWDFGFFDRTGKVARGQGRNYRLLEQPGGERVLAPAANAFTGRTWVLTGPAMSSAGHILARNIRDASAATLVGQATGGSQRGMNGGELAWIMLPNSGVAVDIPLTAWMPDGAPPDTGIAPDVMVTPTFADAQRGIDTEAVAVTKLIAAQRRRDRR